MTSGPVSRACSTLKVLTRLSFGSSIHIRPPPAPQHMALFRQSFISCSWAPEIFPINSRGAS